MASGDSSVAGCVRASSRVRLPRTRLWHGLFLIVGEEADAGDGRNVEDTQIGRDDDDRKAEGEDADGDKREGDDEDNEDERHPEEGSESLGDKDTIDDEEGGDGDDE